MVQMSQESKVPLQIAKQINFIIFIPFKKWPIITMNFESMQENFLVDFWAMK
jgi:hypothetical protein